MKDNSTRIIRGHINIMILKALEEGEKYGYEIGKYIEGKSEGEYILKQPTLYSSLSRLEQKNILSSYWGDELDTNGGRRKYFRLTELGKQIAEKNISEWNEHRKLIDKIVYDKPVTDTRLNAEQKTLSKTDSKDKFNDDLNNILSTKTVLAEEKPSIISVKAAQPLRSSFSSASEDKGNEYKYVLSKLMDNVKSKRTETEKIKNFEPVENSKNNSESFVIQNSSFNTIERNQKIEDEENQVEKSYNLNIPFINREAKQDNNSQNLFSLSKDYNDRHLDIAKVTANSLLDMENKNQQEEQKNAFSLLPMSSDYSQNNFTKLQYQMQQEGYTVRPHTNLKKQTNQFLLENKLSYISMIFLYLILCAETFLIYTFLEPVILIGLKNYLYIAGGLLIFPFASTIQYIVDPNKKTRRKLDIKGYIVTCIMYYLSAVLGITAIALIFGTNPAIQRDLVLTMIIPCIYALNFIFYAIIKSIVYKTQKCHI